MPRRPATFQQHDVVRALRAARAAGLEVAGYEIEPLTGKIVVKTNGEPKPTPESAFDRWLVNRERKNRKAEGRS